jgi:hypothetical protein
MKRSLFLTLVAILGFLFGGMLFLAPAKAVEGFGVASSPESILFFRIMGSMILAAGLLNLLVRKEGDSNALKAVLIFNIVGHGLTMIADIGGVASGTLQFSKIAVGQVNHLFIGIGSLVYLMKMKKMG